MHRLLHSTLALIIGAFVLLVAVPALPVQADGPVVRALLFYSPACGHCHKVITEDLPPLIQRYGTRLEIVGVNVSEAGGSAMFEAAVERFNIQSLGVPMLIVGDVVLVGSQEIPDRFPDLIEQNLARGGVAWPDLPGLVAAISAGQPTPTASSVRPTQTMPAVPTATSTESATRVPTLVALATAIPTPPSSAPPTLVTLVSDFDLPGGGGPDLREKYARDPAGNGLAVIVLIGMIFAVGRSSVIWLGERAASSSRMREREWIIPGLALIGLGVAGYLALVETTQSAAVCGPVGDCNTVQQSTYARLFGVIPIGVLGVAGYIAILIASAVSRYSHDELSDRARIVLSAMTFLGTLFSIYLTFLEPFVIGATCAWCLTSAVVMTALLWLTAAPGLEAALRLRSR